VLAVVLMIAGAALVATAGFLVTPALGIALAGVALLAAGWDLS
jgi:hypothetical protein